MTENDKAWIKSAKRQMTDILNQFLQTNYTIINLQNKLTTDYIKVTNNSEATKEEYMDLLVEFIKAKRDVEDALGMEENN